MGNTALMSKSKLQLKSLNVNKILKLQNILIFLIKVKTKQNKNT